MLSLRECPSEWEKWWSSIRQLWNRCSRSVPYIKSVCVQIPTDGAELEVISCYCPYLKALEIDPTDLNQNILYYFGTKCGHLLEKVKFDGFSYSSLDIREFLKLCPNLKAIDVEPDSLFIREEKHFLPELEDIERIHIRHKNSDLFRKFEILTDKYGNSMKNVKLIMYNYSILQSYQITGDQLKTVVAYLSLFKNLRSLELTLFDGNDENITEPIDDSLAMIGQNCTKLTKLKLVIAGRHIISNNFFNALSQFSNVEKLFLELNVMKNLEGSPQCLKLRRLKYLHIECDGLNKVFLSSFETAVPTLQYANIRVQNRHKVWKKFTNWKKMLIIIKCFWLGNMCQNKEVDQSKFN